MKEKSEKKNVMFAIEWATKLPFPHFSFLASLLNDWEENTRENRENAKDGCHWHQDWHQPLFV